MVSGHTNIILRVESVVVGIFGAFAGGEFFASVFHLGQPGINITTISMAVGVSTAALLLLGLMRRAVGPLKASTKKRHN
jgi:hypothetical protein